MACLAMSDMNTRVHPCDTINVKTFDHIKMAKKQSILCHFLTRTEYSVIHFTIVTFSNMYIITLHIFMSQIYIIWKKHIYSYFMSRYLRVAMCKTPCSCRRTTTMPASTYHSKYATKESKSKMLLIIIGNRMVHMKRNEKSYSSRFYFLLKHICD